MISFISWKYEYRYATYGAILGILFPLIGTIIDCGNRFAECNLDNVIRSQASNSLLWIIDTAPLFLGLLAAYAGKQVDKVRTANAELNEKYIQLNVLRMMADQANKAKSAFLATMSHEIRTPLSAIIGYTGLLKEKRLPSEEESFVKTIGIAAENLKIIIDDILDSSKLEAGMLELEKKPFNLKCLVDNMIRLTQEKAVSKGLKLILNYDKGLPSELIGDETRISQIILNLLSNAIKFTETGQVEFTILERGRRKEGILLRIVVKDSGIGISKENQDRIFDRFVQAESSTSRVYGGTGLGLHIVSSLVQLHNGELSLSSNLNQGSEFQIDLFLPFGANEPTIKKESSRHMPKNQLLNMHILVVEDNEFNQLLAETYLKRNGALVSKAMDGKEALDKIQNTHFDLILMDIQMPIMDGKETTSYIRKMGINTTIIGCSAHALESEKVECIDLGMNGYLTKPFEEVELINILSGFLQTQAKTNNSDIETQNSGIDPVKEILDQVKAEIGPDFVSTVVKKFSEDLPVLISDLKAHLQESDLPSIQSKTHKLAGTLATFKFPAGLLLARNAEFAAKNQKTAETSDAISQLILYLENTLEQLKEF